MARGVDRRRTLFFCLTTTVVYVSLGCASKQTTPNPPPAPVAKTQSLRGNAQSSTADQVHKKAEKLDRVVVENVNAVFSRVLVNDDKKAKRAYGRRHRHIPPFIQFALDLRFKNYDHALSIIDSTAKTEAEKEFWTKIIKGKPVRLMPVICQELQKTDITFKPTDEQLAWGVQLENLVQSLISEQARKQKPSEVETALNQLSCDDKSWSLEEGKCSPLNNDQIKSLLNDTFFDKLRNWHRRDVRYVRDVFRNYMKVREYNRYVSVNNLLRFYRAIESTPEPAYLHNKYIRRYGAGGGFGVVCLEAQPKET